MVGLPFMKQLVIDGLMAAPTPRLPRISFMAIALTACAVLLAFMTLSILMIAEYLYFVQLYVPYIAALIVAASAFLLTALSWGIAKIINWKNSSEMQDVSHFGGEQPDIAKTITTLIDSIAEELEDPIRDNPKTAMAIAGLAGFLAGDQVRPNH